VTLEDIVEEIVEDISDEYDAHEKPVQWIRKLGEKEYLVSGRIDPGSFSEELGVSFPEGQYASLAGFLLERVRDIPTAGTVVRHNKITFTLSVLRHGSSKKSGCTGRVSGSRCANLQHGWYYVFSR